MEPKTDDIMVSATAIIKNEKGEILLENHKKVAAWTLPGGKKQTGEKPVDIIIRECQEELGIEVMSAKLLFTQVFPEGKYEYPVGSGKYPSFQQNYFSVEAYAGTIENKEPEKHSELTWMKPTEVRDKCEKISITLDAYLSYAGASTECKFVF